MVGSIIGAAASLAGTIFGGYQASKAMKKSRRLLEAQLRDNQNWYDRRMSQDYTQTASSQAAMKRAMEYAEQLNRKADGQAAVNGTTDLRPAAEREQANQLMEHTLTNIAASGNAAKEVIEQQYLENKDELTQKRRNLYERKAQEISKAF